jgi:hypothetical protein
VGFVIPTTSTHHEQHIHVSNSINYNTWEVFLNGFEIMSFNKHAPHHLEGIMRGADLQTPFGVEILLHPKLVYVQALLFSYDNVEDSHLMVSWLSPSNPLQLPHHVHMWSLVLTLPLD